MKLHLQFGDIVIEYERRPMPVERFAIVCKLALCAIAGAVLLGTVHMVGVRAVVWAVGALVAYGFYKLARNI